MEASKVVRYQKNSSSNGAGLQPSSNGVYCNPRALERKMDDQGRYLSEGNYQIFVGQRNLKGKERKYAHKVAVAEAHQARVIEQGQAEMYGTPPLQERLESFREQRECPDKPYLVETDELAPGETLDDVIADVQAMSANNVHDYHAHLQSQIQVDDAAEETYEPAWELPAEEQEAALAVKERLGNLYERQVAWQSKVKSEDHEDTPELVAYKVHKLPTRRLARTG